jgi:hypothetical protein
VALSLLGASLVFVYMTFVRLEWLSTLESKYLSIYFNDELNTNFSGCIFLLFFFNKKITTTICEPTCKFLKAQKLNSLPVK